MTLRLTEEETAALRKTAEQEHRSMQEVARAAVVEYTSLARAAVRRTARRDHGRERRRVRAAGQRVTEPAPVTYLSTEDVLVAGERLFEGKLPVRDWDCSRPRSPGPRPRPLARTPISTCTPRPPRTPLRAAPRRFAARGRSGRIFIATSHPLADVDERLELMAMLLFNGYRLSATEDDRVQVIFDIAAGELDSGPARAEPLAGWAVRRWPVLRHFLRAHMLYPMLFVLN